MALTQVALAEHVGGWGDEFVSAALLMFAFSSILYNYYLGENSLNFFSEENRALFNGFRILVLALVAWGSMQDLATVFAFADLTMGLLALVNLCALILLFRTCLNLLNDYERQHKVGVSQPVFSHRDHPDLDIDPEAWPGG